MTSGNATVSYTPEARLDRTDNCDYIRSDGDDTDTMTVIVTRT